MTVETHEDDFCNRINSYDEAWILSGKDITRGDPSVFAQCVADFYNSGKGLYIFANYNPYVEHANLVLAQISTIQLGLRFYGNENLVLGDISTEGQFIHHPLTQGLSYLYEGDYKSVPVISNG